MSTNTPEWVTRLTEAISEISPNVGSELKAKLDPIWGDGDPADAVAEFADAITSAAENIVIAVPRVLDPDSFQEGIKQMLANLGIRPLDTPAEDTADEVSDTEAWEQYYAEQGFQADGVTPIGDEVEDEQVDEPEPVDVFAVVDLLVDFSNETAQVDEPDDDESAADYSTVVNIFTGEPFEWVDDSTTSELVEYDSSDDFGALTELEEALYATLNDVEGLFGALSAEGINHNLDMSNVDFLVNTLRNMVSTNVAARFIPSRIRSFGE